MEIERKFLIKESEWNLLEKPAPTSIAQAYLSTNKVCTIRVRIKGTKGYFTVKGETKGITRSEYEYEIPVEEAKNMMSEFCTKVLSKDRYCIDFEGHTWEVDVFHGVLAPLIIAEIELESEDEQFVIPDWVGKEVSDDASYYNSVLFERL
jgi:adenylate cyclase